MVYASIMVYRQRGIYRYTELADVRMQFNYELTRVSEMYAPGWAEPYPIFSFVGFFAGQERVVTRAEKRDN
jgi:hypothetical protein